MAFKVKRFLCPIHSFQPILSMSTDPSITGGLLYCFVCQATLPLSKKDYLVSIEDFLFELFKDITSSELVKFKAPPPKEVSSTLARLEKLADLFTDNAMLEKNTALHRLSKLQEDFNDMIKRAKQAVSEEFDSKIEFLRQRLETFKLTLYRHFESGDGKGSRLKLNRLFEEVNGCLSVSGLKQTLIRRLCDLKEIRESVLRDPSLETVEEYLGALAEDIEEMAAVFPTSILCDEEYFKSLYESIMKEFGVMLGGALEPDRKKAIESFGRLWSSILVSKMQFDNIRDQIWNDREEQFYLIRRAEHGGEDMEELLRMYDVMENSMMILKDSKSRLIFCLKRGRCLRAEHRNLTIMLMKSGECLKLEAEDMPFDDGRRVYLTKDVCVVPKGRVKSAAEEDLNENKEYSKLLESAVCFGVQKIDPVGSEKMVIMDAELFGVRFI